MKDPLAPRPSPRSRGPLTGVRLDLGQAFQVARAHGALVE
jgi:hypothetical protein